MNMDGDDAQLVDSILREYGSAPQAPVTDLRTSINVPSNFTNTLDMNIESTPINNSQTQQKNNKIDVAYAPKKSIWDMVKLPLIVFVICYLVFNPFVYYYLLKLLPSVFAANTAIKMQIRVLILSLLVAVIFSLITKYV
jgi:uncharacterized membrane protein